MAITKRTVVDQVEVTATGVIQIRMKKEILEDGVVLSSQNHRTALEPGVIAAAQEAAVNEHLAQMKCGAVSGWERVEEIAKAVHTPEVVQGWRDLQAAQRGANKAA